MKVFVKPLLLWKGDTADVPSGSANPEGSDAGPGHEAARDLNADIMDGDELVHSSIIPNIKDLMQGIIGL